MHYMHTLINDKCYATCMHTFKVQEGTHATQYIYNNLKLILKYLYMCGHMYICYNYDKFSLRTDVHV
jgi:hypothetical protein